MIKFPELEQKILDFWKKNNIFQKSLEKEAPQGRFVFFEGPPTANGKPGLHHVLARAFKDLIPRYKTMRGFQVERKAGWDTQGLPVELQVEKELKFQGKPDIEKYGVAKFNAHCREDVWKYKADWEKLTERMGYWLDLEHPYVTYENYYIESLWWILKKVYESGLLYKDYKVLPHCPRCETALSSHEVALGYKSITEPSVYIKFKVKPGQAKIKIDNDTYILSWTTTPWTLPGNVALAVGKNIEYVKARILPEAEFVDSIPNEHGSGYLILAKDIFEKSSESALGGRIFMGCALEVEEVFKGKDLVGLEYEPLFDIKPLQNDKSYRVYAADFVTTTEGSGVVHAAVMYGEDDFDLGTQVGLPKYHTVSEDGHFTKDVVQWAGKFVKDKEVEAGIVEDLKKRELLFKQEMYTHDYPFCWRCSTPLLYYAKPSWFIKMSELREEMKAANEKINWYPEHIKHGRFGEWLDGAKDWAISRERYWGTPLPIWVCDKCKEIMCVGSLEELAKLASNHESRIMNHEFDIHRPFIDEITWSCKCGGTMKRVPEVADCWFDSGSMPFAQWGYPYLTGSSEQIANSYPADFISEAIDQTRGWFYTLLAVATLLKKSGAIKEIPPYKNVICLGHINDKHGQKMSKSKGNIVDPWEIFAKYGADALRFHFYTANQPGEPKNFDPQAVEEVVKRTLLILMNVLTFYELYKQDDPVPTAVSKSPNILDQWILALLQKLINEITEHLEKYEITEAGRKITEFITELSTWYVRRSRERFKEDGEDKNLARSTLGFVLYKLAILLAPFTPFIAEELYRRLQGGQESVHLDNWPTSNDLSKDQNILLSNMSNLRQAVELALAKRAESKIKVRQPLRLLKVTGLDLTDDLKKILAEEVNVLEVTTIKDDSLSCELDIKLDEELKDMGLVREFIRQVNALRKEKKLTVKDKVNLKVSAPDNIVKALQSNEKQVIKSTIASKIDYTKETLPEKIEIDGVIITINLIIN
ncbi:MAG: isoleucine--tRNA ligase [Patescibacteria group bacterium]